MKTIDKTTGTSFHGVTVTASVNQLKQILGEPTIVDNNGEYKVNYEWCIANYNGEPASIYDWKYFFVDINDKESLKIVIAGFVTIYCYILVRIS